MTVLPTTVLPTTMLPTTMLAARFRAPGPGVRVERVPVPLPGPGEVLVRVAYCGICMSDVHMIDGTLPALVPEVTPGHESSGTIAAVGTDVPEAWRVGADVVLVPGRRCGACAACAAGGQMQHCTAVQIMGSSYDGAWAEYVVVSYPQLVAVPDGVPLDQAAVLADAVTTPYAALVDTAVLRPAESVGIWGLGGLGTHAVQVARMLGAAPVVAVDPDRGARERALALGADIALDPADPDLLGRVLAATGGAGLDVAAEFVGRGSVREQALRCLARSGRLVMVGLAPDPLVLSDAMTPVMRSQSLRGHLGGDRDHLAQLVSLVRYGRLDVSRSVSGTYPLSRLPEALELIARRDGQHVRLVIDPRRT